MSLALRHQNTGSRNPRRSARFVCEVEPLEGRALMSRPALAVVPPQEVGAAPSIHQDAAVPIGVVRKAPHFYEFYTGPKRDSLNVVAASARLFPRGAIVLAGATNGEFISVPPAIYVFGIDRNGSLPPGPFPGKPNIRFDALVVVTLKPPPAPPTAVVMYLNTGKSVTLPQDAITFKSRQVLVQLTAKLLPSTGLPVSHYLVNFWARSAPGKPNRIASFVPESSMFQIGPGS